MLKSNWLILLVTTALLIGSIVIGGVMVNDFYKKNMPTSCKDFEGHYIWLPKDVSDLFYCIVISNATAFSLQC